LRVAMRGHHADGLVIAPEPCAVGFVHHGAVDLHQVALCDEGGGMGDGRVVQPDTALGEQLLRVAAAGDAGTGQPLRDAFAAPRPSCRVAAGAQAAMSASKMRRSPGSMRNSGCHCTPRQKRRRESSMPSMMLSGAVALTTACGPGSRTAWWCAEFTCITPAPT